MIATDDNPVLAHLARRDFTFFNPASASPFRRGLYGDASSCFMLFSAHHRLNGPMNCGPPSDLMLAGQPRMLNHVSRKLMTDWVVVEFNLLYRGNPNHLSTHMRCFLPSKSKRSRPTCNWCVECGRWRFRCAWIVLLAGVSFGISHSCLS